MVTLRKSKRKKISALLYKTFGKEMGDSGTVKINKKLTSLARKGLIRIPLRQGKLPPFKSVKATGKPASEIIVEERR
jgi:hypothetical protein